MRSSQGLGRHTQDPKNPDKCYCSRIYGQRDYRTFGYIREVRPEYSQKRIQDEERIAAWTNAVVLRTDATVEKKQDIENQAEMRWLSSGCVAAWGCEWFSKWFQKVKEAVDRGQQLKAVFFPGQVGEGIPSMEQLCDRDFDPWNGVGCGGSQKAELATLRQQGWSFEGVDVTQFLRDSFQPEDMVDALCEGSWKRCRLVRQLPHGVPDLPLWTRCTIHSLGTDCHRIGASIREPLLGHRMLCNSTNRSEICWSVRCLETGNHFEASQLRHTTVAVTSLRTLLSRGPRLSQLSRMS